MASDYTYIGKSVSNLINLIPIQFEDLKSFWGFEDELNQLQQSLITISNQVEDAEEKQRTMADVGWWLRNLKEVTYEVDDLLSELAYETTLLQVHSFSSISRAIRKAKFRRQMVPKLQEVNESLQNIQRQSQSLQLSSIQHNLEDMLSQNRLPIDSILDNSVVGRKGDVAKIVNLLTSSCYEQLTVIRITGISGIGKTTLAKLVCQRVMALTRKPFDVKIWVCFYDDFSPYKVLREMLQSLNASMGVLTEKDAIRQLKKELVSKKFLLVLDDVWNKDHMRWDLLKTLLSRICTNNGNAILVTTRVVEEVASVMETSSQHSHHLKSVSHDECWLILKERAFGKVTKPVPSNLEAIGRELAKKCGGVPLVAKVLGGTMRFNRKEETWLKFTVLKEVEISNIFQQYMYHLPSYLKPCFAFCSNFPKGFLIRKEELIWLWMAEGIVESCDMGNKCFDALLASSSFQDAEREQHYDDIIRCKMHNLVREFLLTVSRYKTSSIYNIYADDQFVPYLTDTLRRGAKKFRTIILSGASNKEIWKMERLRGLHLLVADMEVLPSSIRKMKHLRYLGVSISKTKELPKSITKLYNLQTLNLSNSSITKLPKFITKPFNLQNLNLSNSNIEELPESINKLHSLQTLNVSDSNIKELPESITELCNLQALKFSKCKELTKLPRKKINNLIRLKHIAFSYEHQMPFGLGKLNGLETLLFFVVGLDWGGSIDELQYLNKLRGGLKITRLEEVRGKEEAERANLQGKAEMQGLVFQWSYKANDRSSNDEELLEALQPHANIEKIKIKYYMGEKWPSWMLRMKSPGHGNSFAVINNLVDLRLVWCCNCVQLPRLGDLPHLNF